MVLSGNRAANARMHDRAFNMHKSANANMKHPYVRHPFIELCKILRCLFWTGFYLLIVELRLTWCPA